MCIAVADETAIAEHLLLAAQHISDAVAGSISALDRCIEFCRFTC
jgi:hypothetical protein